MSTTVRRRLLSVIALAAVVGRVALAGASDAAQDLVAVAPDAAKVEYESARLRVVRLKMPPHTSSPMHDRPARVVIPLTANDVRLTRADGRVTTTQAPAHRPAWSEPGRRAVENLDRPLENIIVELKTADAPGRAVDRPPSPVPSDYLAEPRHQWRFENQYVRVYEVRIAPGATTEFHRHAYEAVAVHISGGLIAVQMQGGDWGATTTMKPGSLTFDADPRTQYVHRVRNDGTAEYHVILVQLLR